MSGIAVGNHDNRSGLQADEGHADGSLHKPGYAGQPTGPGATDHKHRRSRAFGQTGQRPGNVSVEHPETPVLPRWTEKVLQPVQDGPLGSTFVRYLFLDPTARTRIVNWSYFASTAVAALRRETGRRPFDARLKALVAELRSANQDVDTWWDDHGVRDYASVHKEINHPPVGRMTFDIESVSPPYDPDQRLVIYTVEPGSPTAQLLPILASWLPGPASPRIGSQA